MKTVLIVWHSRTGGALQMAKAAADGAQGDAHVRLVAAGDAGADDMLASDGYLFAAPENLAALSGLMKDFYDRAYYAALDRIGGRPYGLMISAGSDGAGTVRQVARIAAGWRLRLIAEPIVAITRAQTAETILAPKTMTPDVLAHCRELGAAMAGGLAMGVF